jgi:glycine/D-amino acid oxidase-like deaminating enzyme
MDEALTALHEASLRLYAELGHGFELPAEPSGVLVVSDDRAALEADRAELASRFPALAAEWLEGGALAEAEPALGAGLAAYRLATGRPVPPAAAARAWARRAEAAGADLRIGAAVDRVEARHGRVAGVVVGGEPQPAGAVVVAAGPWTPELVERRPIAALWGVVAEVRMAVPPVHMLEQAGVEELTSPSGAGGWIFSAVTLDGVSAIGSTFMPTEPDPAAVAPQVLERAVRFLPALEGAAPLSVRACPRPQSGDGRPLLGPAGGIDGLHVASGHGPWGISLGPGSAELVAGALLGRGEEIPAELAAGRF